MSESINRQILLVEKPAGKLGSEHFKMKEGTIPEPRDGEALLRVRYISLDAANRAWMHGATYRAAVEANTVMAGGGIAEVISSKAPELAKGDIVFGDTGWQDFAAVPAKHLTKMPKIEPMTYLLSVYGIAGLTAYGFWNRTIYAELGAYGTSRGPLSVLHAGLHDDEVTKLAGLNPYWRLAWSHDWGPHSLMIGTSGMMARIYDDPLDTSDSATLHHTRDLILDSQYQYLLDPHAVTAQLVYETSRNRYPAALANQPSPFVDAGGNALAPSNAQDTTHLLRAKLTYVYQAKYGGSVGFFNLTGSTNSANQSSGFSPDTLSITSDPAVQAPSLRVGGSLNGNPATRGATLEAFWMPIQYVRLGLQYTAYSRYNGASTNYDGFGRNARDNNSLFVYLWAAY